MPKKEDPKEIAQQLIEEHGVDGAIQIMSDSIAKAHEDGDLYRLSLWRESRRIVQEKKTNAA